MKVLVEFDVPEEQLGQRKTQANAERAVRSVLNIYGFPATATFRIKRPIKTWTQWMAARPRSV